MFSKETNAVGKKIRVIGISDYYGGVILDRVVREGLTDKEHLNRD